MSRSVMSRGKSLQKGVWDHEFYMNIEIFMKAAYVNHVSDLSPGSKKVNMINVDFLFQNSLLSTTRISLMICDFLWFTDL